MSERIDLEAIRAEQRMSAIWAGNAQVPWARKYAEHTGWLLTELEQAREELRRVREAMVEYSQEASASRERAGRAERSLLQARTALAAAQERAKCLEGLLACERKNRYVLGSNYDRVIQERDAARHELNNLLAIIHRDGGQHTGDVGIEQSAVDAHQVWARLIDGYEDARREVEALREVVVRIRERHDGSIGADTRICRCSDCEAIRGVLSGATSPDPHDAEIERLRGQVAAKDAAILEAAEWLESRPDMNEGDAATSSRLRAALSTNGAAEAAAREAVIAVAAALMEPCASWDLTGERFVALRNAVAAMQGEG